MNAIREYLPEREKFIQILKIENPDYKEKPNLFLNKDGDFFRPRYIGKLWKKFAKKNDIDSDVTYHGLRHSYITYQMNYNPDVSPKEVQTLAGHADIKTTYGYVHKSPIRIKKSTSVFENVFLNKIIENPDGTLDIPITQLGSIISGKELSKTEDIFKALNKITNKEISLLNVSTIMNHCREYLLSNYPSLEKINNINKNIDIKDFTKILVDKFGEKFTVEQLTNNNDLDMS